MEIILFDILKIAGSLALFIFGMKVMSEGIQQAAGQQIRSILRSITKNRLVGFLTGLFTTSVVQSSSAVTVMIVSFVNAGLITLYHSAAVIMGANVGTTVTVWLVVIGGFLLDLSQLSLPLLAIGVPLLFTKKGRWRFWAEFFIGFAILFLGLNYLKSSIPDIKGNTELLESLSMYTSYGFLSRLLFVGIGMILTIIIQSSSAATTLTVTMCLNGWLPFEMGAAMVLGENIGTTITAEISALVANIHAKRSARIHTLFNIIGALWMVILLPFFLDILAWLVDDVFGQSDPFNNEQSMTIALAAFHSLFNSLNVILLIGFVPWLVQLARWTLPIKRKKDRKSKLKYIDSTVRSPELALVELQRELYHFGELADQMSELSRSLLNSTNSDEQADLIKRILKLENRTDKLESRIIDYVVNVSKDRLTKQTSFRLKSILSIANDLERVGDIFQNIAIDMRDKINEKIWFTPEQRNHLNALFDLLSDAFQIMLKNLSGSDNDEVTLEKAKEAEKKINQYRDELKRNNLSHIHTYEFNIKGSMLYTKMFSSLENIGDYVYKVTESIVEGV